MQMTITFELTILYLVAINAIAILVFVLAQKHRTRRTLARVAQIKRTIVDYFQRSNTLVRVDCIATAGGKRFIAHIDSQPSKRFRHSHIVEIGLRLYVLKSCQLELERVYWRFVVKQHDATAEDTDSGDGNDADLYLSETELLLKARSEYAVQEIPWEKYQRILQADAA